MSLTDVLQIALQLSDTDRAELVSQLLLSLEPETPDAGHEGAWREEIEARLRKVEEGNYSAHDWREALDQIRQTLPRGPVA
jgi:putative addiction module component (TIGR02574 family)